MGICSEAFESSAAGAFEET